MQERDRDRKQQLERFSGLCLVDASQLVKPAAREPSHRQQERDPRPVPQRGNDAQQPRRRPRGPAADAHAGVGRRVSERTPGGQRQRARDEVEGGLQMMLWDEREKLSGKEKHERISTNATHDVVEGLIRDRCVAFSRGRRRRLDR